MGAVGVWQCAVGVVGVRWVCGGCGGCVVVGAVVGVVGVLLVFLMWLCDGCVGGLMVNVGVVGVRAMYSAKKVDTGKCDVHLIIHAMRGLLYAHALLLGAELLHHVGLLFLGLAGDGDDAHAVVVVVGERLYGVAE